MMYTALLICIKSFNECRYCILLLVCLRALGEDYFLQYARHYSLFSVVQKAAALSTVEHCYCTNLSRLASKYFRLLGNSSY